MVNPQTIKKRLDKLDEYLAILEDLRAKDWDDFSESPQLYGSAERFLQLAIECLNDMGSHVISDEGWGNIEWYSHVPQIFYEHHQISDELRQIWVQMIGFRNILVHAYLDIDRRIVYAALQNQLHIFYALRAVFARWL